MTNLAAVMVALTALLHLYFMVLEMFFLGQTFGYAYFRHQTRVRTGLQDACGEPGAL